MSIEGAGVDTPSVCQMDDCGFIRELIEKSVLVDLAGICVSVEQLTYLRHRAQSQLLLGKQWLAKVNKSVPVDLRKGALKNAFVSQGPAYGTNTAITFKRCRAPKSRAQSAQNPLECAKLIAFAWAPIIYQYPALHRRCDKDLGIPKVGMYSPHPRRPITWLIYCRRETWVRLAQRVAYGRHTVAGNGQPGAFIPKCQRPVRCRIYGRQTSTAQPEIPEP